jgi:pectate lyase
MKKHSTFLPLFLFSFTPLYAQPNFDLVGYATLNGGTTGGKGGKEILVSCFDSLKKYAEEPETPYVIKVKGTITGTGSIATKNYNGSIKVASNKTIEGMGKTAFLNGVGVMVLAQRNIILRHLRITLSGIVIPAEMREMDIPAIYKAKGDEGRAQLLINDGDCITIKGTSSNVWVDHCEVFNEDPEKQPNQDLYDGLIDIKNASSYVTVSWCYLHDHHKCTLVGSSDKDEFDRKITFHHNYYRNIDERMPSFRFGTAHVFNNYYSHLRVSGINSRMGACLKIEKNHFEDSKDPIITRNSKMEGKWEVSDNKFTQCTGSQPDSSTCVAEKIPYDYAKALTEVRKVKRDVMKYAGVGKK